MNSKLLLLICGFMLLFHQGYAQQSTITGKVIDPDDGLGIPGVNILVEGTTIGTVTDVDGNFNVRANTNDVLVFSFVGYTTQKIEVAGRSIINIEMLADLQSLSEVIVVGYGTQKRSDITGAVASYKAEQLETMPTVSLGQALQGRVAGLAVTNNGSGVEGDNVGLQIRGRNSLAASSEPFIILDGIPYNGRLSEINPMDIASLEVLKDASSAAIYGARAANGVILITTKRGTIGKAKISYDTYFGIDQISNIPDLMDGNSFYNTKVDRYGLGSISQSEQIAFENGVNTDWLELATRMGTRQQHNLSLSGGTEDTKYFISGNYLDAKGVAKNDDLVRTTLRLNVDTKITPWLTLGTSNQLLNTDKSANAANFGSAFTMNPLTTPFQEDGETLTIFPWPEDSFFSNPLEPFNVLNEDKTRRIITQNYLQIDIPFVEGLKFRVNTGYDYRYRAIDTYSGRNTRSGLQQGGVATTNNWQEEDWIVENILTYDKTFGKHTVGFTGLYSAQERWSKNHNLTASGFPSDIMTNYQNNLATVWNPSDSYTQWNYLSQMARVNYGYDSKYLLTLTARRDGYSGFGDATKFGIFPSVAVGWNLDRESFLENIPQITAMKLRASYGENGNQAIAPYSTLPGLSVQNYLDDLRGTAFGFYPSGIGDPSLGWETSKSANFGVDFGLFENRIQGSVDYFMTTTVDLLLNRNISQVNGTGVIRQNIGSTRNRGLDLQISSINIDKRDWKWTTDLTFSFFRNEIVDVGLRDENGNPADDLANRWFIGEPLNVNFSYLFDGIWQVGDDIVNSAQPTARPGDIRVRDVNGDGTINADDRTFIGNAIPDFIAGLNNTVSYKNLSLQFFISTVQGLTKGNELMNPFFDGRARTLNRDWWTAESPNNVWPANRDDSNAFQVQYFGRSNNASFVRLNDVTLSYRLNAPMLSKWKLGRAEVYINAKNLVTITDWEGTDPELGSQRSIPFVKSYIAGFRVQF
ncbi:TonB-dependent receptor [Belliella sp. DSM 107340]|uniref:TonB-dependent receptor n=1 Tax=Belliella calami TaxID=2923436 RepID=A0ABS9UTY4_9BACT|nr:TonB-dependent receptor [Belliella calami]MCH7400085.1 TonB-dependent receptor [Belliella calami]